MQSFADSCYGSLAMRNGLNLYRRTRRLRLCLLLAVFAWSVLEVLYVRYAIAQQLHVKPELLRNEKIFIASIHWNNEQILRESWIQAVVQLVDTIGRGNVFISIQESGSWDGSKDALLLLDRLLAKRDIPRRIILDHTTHLDEISRPPGEKGWVRTPLDRTELRRIPYLAGLRNSVLQPLYEKQNSNITFDKILFLGDVVFTTEDIYKLLSTRGGKYAAACAMDFSKPPEFYDTFALRDAEGHKYLMQTWPYFRSRRSRQALKHSQPVPVASCWNGIADKTAAMDASPFYGEQPLQFRGISDGLASLHLEGSECCLIHADNPLSKSKGVWLNPDVRVGYNTSAFQAVHPTGHLWPSTRFIFSGLWKNRLLRWFTTTWIERQMVRRRLHTWQQKDVENRERAPFCLVNEMQVLVANGWAYR